MIINALKMEAEARIELAMEDLQTHANLINSLYYSLKNCLPFTTKQNLTNYLSNQNHPPESKTRR